MKSEFILGHNFKEYIKEAIGIYVASNFLSRAIIDNIKSTLNELPFHGGKNFRFLLNHDFHEDESMRQVLINMLLEIPNVEVRIYEGPKRFHAKLYIFESGNTFFTAVGSFNATAGGAGRNIEVGIRNKERGIYKEAKSFFDEHWSSKYTKIAKIDENAEFIKKKFRVGDLVIENLSGEKGVIHSNPPKLLSKKWFYSVYLNGDIKKIAEDDLSHQKISYINNELDFIYENKSIDLKTWLFDYLIVKASDLTDRTLLSYSSSRTKTLEYQFKPLFKLLNTKEHRLLIADEVGLGKTIEAGIILKELSARSIFKKVLIIVPNALKTKWKDELRIRFDEYFDIINYKSVISFLSDYKRSPESACLIGIITYDQLVNPNVSNYLKNFSTMPQFDLIVIDEAHHLKNPETIRHKVISKFAQNAKALIMLTATPIQLHTKDLYNLLTILLPHFHFGSSPQNFAAKLTLNERINLSVKYLTEKKFKQFNKVISELITKRTFKKQLDLMGGFDTLFEESKTIDENSDAKTIRHFAQKLFGYNILNTYVNRTLRKNVSLNFPDRIIETCEYEYSDEERIAYDDILNICREKYTQNSSAFGIIIPERRAASSLIAMKLSYNKSDWENEIEEYCNNYEEEYESNDNVRPYIKYDLNTIIDSSVDKLKIDSKLNKLVEIIENLFSQRERNSEKKIIIFCAFRATVIYLKNILSKKYPELNIYHIMGGDEIYDRDKIKKKFSKNDKPALLICTEVAGEGLDFQFCQNIVNYDMPWNPSKLEQRVGRIDRIGQAAEKIFVFNLVNASTIEDRIMSRLFERVKLFNSTIGPLGEILSSYQKDFKKSILSPTRTKQEKELYEKKILENVDEKNREQKDFEEKEMAIIGAMEKFLYDKKINPQYFNERETKILWDFILDRTGIGKEYISKVDDNKKVYAIKIESKNRRYLNDLLDNNPFEKYNNIKNLYYKKYLEKLLLKNEPLYYTFRQDTALEEINIEHFTLTHPFLQGGIQKIFEGFRIQKNCLFCKINTEIVNPGNYTIIIYRFTVINGHAGKRELVEEKYLCVPFKDKIKKWDVGEKLFNTILNAKNVTDIKYKDITETLTSLQKSISEEVTKMAEKILDNFIRKTEDRLKAQKKSLGEFYDNKISLIRKNMQYIHDPEFSQSHEKEIVRLNKEKEEKFLESKLENYTITSKSTGIIYVEVE